MKILILLILSTTTSQMCLASTCSQLFSSKKEFTIELKASTKASVVIKATGKLITGESNYPIKQVLKNLNISNELSALWADEGLKVLSVAEGESGLLPYLIKKNVDAKGLDLWYSTETKIPKNKMGSRMFQYRKKNQEHLIAGSALDMPVPNSSVDVVLSHYLFNNLPGIENSKALMEIMRVLKVGGEARIYPIVSIGNFEYLLTFLKKNFPKQVSNLSYDGQILVFRKTTEDGLDIETKDVLFIK